MEGFLPDPDATYPTVEDRMRLAVGLARANVDYGSGGPFGAASFDPRTTRLVVPGVNLVIATNCAVAHANMVAIISRSAPSDTSISVLKGNHPTSWSPVPTVRQVSRGHLLAGPSSRRLWGARRRRP